MDIGSHNEESDGTKNRETFGIWDNIGVRTIWVVISTSLYSFVGSYQSTGSLWRSKSDVFVDMHA